SPSINSTRASSPSTPDSTMRKNSSTLIRCCGRRFSMAVLINPLDVASLSQNDSNGSENRERAARRQRAFVWSSCRNDRSASVHARACDRRRELLRIASRQHHHALTRQRFIEANVETGGRRDLEQRVGGETQLRVGTLRG